ncbi:MAG: GH3 auxin-responsive promoter family protein [Planctomycetales bacterium]|nr:GH3 auxin-responsive promoter family protein [Planctomycetales bacterium]
MNRLTYGLNTLWMLSCLRERRKFERATHDVESTQRALLLKVLERNSTTAFGAAHGFDRIRSPSDFQNRVQPRSYDDFREDIERIARGEHNVLTRDSVEIFEPTSGTTSGEKLIPYTADLRHQFQRAISAWIGDLFSTRPAVRRGKAYWSISPAFGLRRQTVGGIPIGFEDDTEYLGFFERQFASRLMAVPGDVANIPDIDEFRYQTLLHLMLADDLSLISVWNPTFLTVLLDSIDANCDRLRRDLRTAHSGRRSQKVELILRSEDSLPDKLRLLWKDLVLISCWTDAAAAHGLSELTGLFPEVEIQPKGLIATEAIVSYPLVDRPGAALAIRSHFFEFRASGSDDLRLAHELAVGERYEVVVTTGGGLYRYQLKDLIEVRGFENECPLIRFVGKANRVSDLVGEKLGEPHVNSVLKRAFASVGLGLPPAMLVPSNGQPPHYRLVLGGIAHANGRENELKRIVSDGLEENPYFRHAVAIGQLGPLEVHVLGDEEYSPWQAYETKCLTEGQKQGDIKPTVLGVGILWDPMLRHPSPRSQ